MKKCNQSLNLYRTVVVPTLNRFALCTKKNCWGVSLWPFGRSATHLYS